MAKTSRLTDADRAAVSQSVKHARLVEASRKLARIVKHTDPEPEAQRERDTLDASLSAWMRYHGGEAFDQPFSRDHDRVLSKIEHAINKGGLFALAMPRGHGKSTILKWATLYCILTGRRRYVVIVAATAEMAQAVVDFVRQQIQESESLHAHYPHVTTYARATDGKAIKARYQLRADGKTSGIHWSKNTLVLPEVVDPDGEPYASNGAILEGHGLTGAIRGKWKDTKTGRVLRPDFVLLDDPQTRESAESESQCAMRERIITGDVLGLAGPRKKIAAVMPCTIVQPGDLAARFLDHEKHPEWSGETCKLVETWPDEQDGLWVEYARLYRDGISQGSGTAEAFDFYRAKRADMDKGAVVSWPERVRDGELSALHTAENLLIETGDQFWAEYQNDPKARSETVYTLTPELIRSREQPDRKPGVVPDWSQSVFAATDVNPSYALSTVVAAFGANQVAAVLWYGLYRSAPLPVPKEATEIEKRRIIYEALAAHGKQIAALPCRPAMWTIDGGGSPEGCVIQLAHNSPQICGLQASCCFGRGWRTYRPTGKSTYRIKVGEQLHHVSERRDRQWIIYNADYWREIAQRGWTGQPGAPGSCSLPAGRHNEFSEQVCREQLAGKDEIGGRHVWVWNTWPGPHDFGDCMTMLYMIASHAGIGTGAAPAQSTRKKYSVADLKRSAQ
jgi:hypothetical protein